MISRDIRDKRKELFKQTVELQDIYLKTNDYNKSSECMKKERELYDKWKFYNNFIKQVEKEKKYGKTK